MKNALLLSGLQRNHYPFIKNQLKLLIEVGNIDVFISTSCENNNRVLNNYNIYYNQNSNFTNDEKYFYDLYGNNLKLVFIDDGSADLNFKNLYIKNNNYTTNFHNGLISSYFKIYTGLQMIINYEILHNIKYDNIMRIRLDGFLLNLFDMTIFDCIKDNELIASKTLENHEDDSCFIVKSCNIRLVQNFIFTLIKTVSQIQTPIYIEQLFFNYCKENYINIIFKTNLICRIGGYNLLYNTVPYLSYDDFTQLKSLEYKLQYDNKT